MKQTVSEFQNGIQIENMLSMSLEKPVRKRQTIYLLFLAFTGILSSIFTFLSLFSTGCSVPVLLTVTIILFAFFSLTALHPKRCTFWLFLSVILYGIVFFLNKSRLVSGLMYLTNDVCQTIYQNNWEYFNTNVEYTAQESVTMTVCFLSMPLIWLVCYAVLRYHNFILSFLITFPLLEIGLFFGIVPNYLSAGILTAFWIAMLGVETASSGITQHSQSGFLRKNNKFIPVSDMRFLLSEKTGLTLFLGTLLLFSGVYFLFQKSGYDRPEQFKLLRAGFQNVMSRMNLTDPNLPGTENNTFPTDNSRPQDIPLGSQDERQFANLPVSEVAFSENPNSRIYLKYRTGYEYQGSRWTPFTDQTAQQENFRKFQNVNYYPPEFLYDTVPLGTMNYLSYYHASTAFSRCVPYGFEKNNSLLCQSDDSIQTNIATFRIQSGLDYELYLLNPDTFQKATVQELLDSAVSLDKQYFDLSAGKEMTSVWKNSLTSAPQAGILSGSFYDDTVYAEETALPDTPELQAVREAFHDLLQFDARNATPTETILQLEAIRAKVCANVTYTLSPGKTPADRDNTAYFLLENQKGYCEHYATAVTVLARMSGIPARYCEGYMIDCTQDILTPEQTQDGSAIYTAEVLDSNAHAWTEIYISGLGWIPFECTFSYFPEKMTLPETLPPETQAPTAYTPPETIAPTQPPTLPAESSSVPEKREIPPQLLGMIILLTVLACLCLLAILFRIARVIALKKRTCSYQQESRKESAFYAYQYFISLLGENNVRIHGTNIGDLVEDAEKRCSQYMSPVYSLSAAVQIGAKLRYSPHPMTTSELHYLIQTADELAKGMYQQAGFFKKFYFKWIRHYL